MVPVTMPIMLKTCAWVLRRAMMPHTTASTLTIIPISDSQLRTSAARPRSSDAVAKPLDREAATSGKRSEERRVGKERRSGRAGENYKEKSKEKKIEGRTENGREQSI